MHLFKTKIGLLRILGFLEGVSLLILVFVAVPMKYYYGNHSLSKTLGPVHGALFLLFLLVALLVGLQQKWTYKTGLLVFVACFIPFGTFYLDSKIFSKIQSAA